MSDAEALSKVKDIIAQSEAELKSIEVIKEIPLVLDTANLVTLDNNEVDKTLLRNPAHRDDYMKELAREGVQAMLNSVWELEVTTFLDGTIFAVMPKQTLRIPREKPLPKPKEKTRWEEFALQKGISMKKDKPKKIWDESLQKWLPNYGFMKARAEKRKNWAMEVPDNADPMEDPFIKQQTEKEENVSKNEYQRLCNIARNKDNKLYAPNHQNPKKKVKKGDAPPMAPTAATLDNPKDMGKTLDTTRLSTRSVGRFQQTLRMDKDIEEVERKGKKRILPPNVTVNTTIDAKNEREKALELMKKIKRPGVDMEAAVNEQLQKEKKMEKEFGHMKKKKTNPRRSKNSTHRRKSHENSYSMGLSKDKPGERKTIGRTRIMAPGSSAGRGRGGSRGGRGGSRGGRGGSRGGRGGSKGGRGGGGSRGGSRGGRGGR